MSSNSLSSDDTLSSHATGLEHVGTAHSQAQSQGQQTRTVTRQRTAKDDPAVWPDDIVTWDGPDDPANPMNWPKLKKGAITILLGLMTMGASFASSSFSPTFDAVSAEFGVSQEVTILTLSLYVLGFAFGPLVR